MNIRMKKREKIIIFILIILLVYFIFNLIHLTVHNTYQEDCKVCLIINNFKKCLAGLIFDNLLITIMAFSLVKNLKNEIRNIFFINNKNTLISLKVQFNN